MDNCDLPVIFQIVIEHDFQIVVVGFWEDFHTDIVFGGLGDHKIRRIVPRQRAGHCPAPRDFFEASLGSVLWFQCLHLLVFILLGWRVSGQSYVLNV